jgi:hypothetical protein
MKFRKKPVIIDAWYWNGSTIADARIFQDINNLPPWRIGSRNGMTGMIIPTLEGDHVAIKGDWILKGVAGEYYPCKPDIFKNTYEEVK